MKIKREQEVEFFENGSSREIKVDVKVLLRHNFCCKTQLDVLTLHCRHGFTYIIGCI